MAEYEWTDVDRENERRQNELNARKASSGMTRDAALGQYRDYISSLGGRWDPGMQNDFDNIWRQSAEASEFGGAGLDQAQSFAENFEGFKPRLQQRWLGEAGQDATDDSGRVYGGGGASQATAQYSGGGGGGGSQAGGGALQALLAQLQADQQRQTQERADVRQILMGQLDTLQQPVSESAPGVREVLQGQRLALQRGAERARGEAAERRAYDGSGGVGSRAYTTDVDRILQQRGEADARMTGDVLGERLLANEQRLTQLLSLAMQLGDAESARNIQQQLQAIQQQIGESQFGRDLGFRYDALAQGGNQFNDSLAFQYAGLNQNANRDALLAVLGLL